MSDSPDPQPATTSIGGDQINVRESPGFINRAESVTQTFVEAPAQPRIPVCPAPNAAELFGRAAMISDLARMARPAARLWPSARAGAKNQEPRTDDLHGEPAAAPLPLSCRSGRGGGG